MSTEDLKNDLVTAMNENPAQPTETTAQPTETTVLPAVEPRDLEALVASVLGAQKNQRLQEEASRRAVDPIAVAEDIVHEAEMPEEIKAVFKGRIAELLRTKPNVTVDDGKWLAETYIASYKADLEQKTNSKREYEARRELDMFKKYGEEFRNIEKGMTTALADKWGATEAVVQRRLDDLSHEDYHEQVAKYYRETHIGGKNPYAKPIEPSKRQLTPAEIAKFKADLGL